MAELSDCAN